MKIMNILPTAVASYNKIPKPTQNKIAFRGEKPDDTFEKQNEQINKRHNAVREVAKKISETESYKFAKAKEWEKAEPGAIELFEKADNDIEIFVTGLFLTKLLRAQKRPEDSAVIMVKAVNKLHNPELERYDGCYWMNDPLRFAYDYLDLNYLKLIDESKFKEKIKEQGLEEEHKLFEKYVQHAASDGQYL